MQKFNLFLLLMTLGGALGAGETGFCRKCETLKEYHKNNPSKYTFYEDYLKELEATGQDPNLPTEDELPPDVKFIINLEKVGVETQED